MGHGQKLDSLLRIHLSSVKQLLTDPVVLGVVCVCVCMCVCVYVSYSVVSNSLLPHGSMVANPQQPSRLLCPWNSPGKNTGVGCHSLLQRIFPTKGSNPGLHCRQILYHLSHREPTWDRIQPLIRRATGFLMFITFPPLGGFSHSISMTMATISWKNPTSGKFGLHWELPSLTYGWCPEWTKLLGGSIWTNGTEMKVFD